jgi:hypothetical protein
MGSILVSDAIGRAQSLLEDKTAKTWPASELLNWFNDGQSMIVQLRPDAYTATRVVPLIAGTRQAIPTNDLVLIDVPRNMGTDGETPGMACVYIDRKQLDNSNPSWHAVTADDVIQHWMYDKRVPKTWWCYPPQPDSSQGYAELDVSAVPPLMTLQGIAGAAQDSTLSLDDVWLNQLLQFTVYRAYSKDAEYTQAGGKADMAWREFLQVMGLRTETDIRFDPKQDRQPRNSEPPKSENQGAFS